MALLNGVAGRPAVAAKLLALDALAAIVDTLRRASPAEWVSTTGFARRPHGMAFWFLKDLVDPAQAGGTDLTAQLQGAEEFPTFQDEVLAAVEEVIQRRTGAMKGLAQVRVLNVEKANVKPLV